MNAIWPLLERERHFVLAAVVTVLHLFILLWLAHTLGEHGGSFDGILRGQDESEYTRIGQSLVTSGEFRISEQFEIETFRTPGYPALVAVILFLTGSLSLVYIVHAFLVGATSGIIAWIGENIGLTKWWEIAAGALFGISSGPLLLTLSGMGSDTLFILLYTLAAALLFALPRSAYRRAALIGIVLGLATLTRPIGILASLPLIAAVAFFSFENILAERKQRAIALFVALIAFAGTLVPWHIRNYSVAGHFSLSSLPEYNFAMYNIPLFFAHAKKSSETEEIEKVVQKLGNPNLMTLRGFAYHEELTAMRREFLEQHAFAYALFHFYKMIPFIPGSGLNVAHAIIAVEAPTMRSPLFPTEDENLTAALLRGDMRSVIRNIRSYPVVTFERLSWLVIFALTALSPFLARGRARQFLLLSLLLIFTFAFLSSPVIQPRYRVPAEPFLWLTAVYSAYALVQWRGATKDSTPQP